MKHRIGKCPQCDGSIVEFSKFYGCDNFRPIDGSCPFTIPKRFAGREVPPHIAAELISRRCTQKLNGFLSRKGNMFSAILELQFNGKLWRLKMRFNE